MGQGAVGLLEESGCQDAVDLSGGFFEGMVMVRRNGEVGHGSMVVWGNLLFGGGRLEVLNASLMGWK